NPLPPTLTPISPKPSPAPLRATSFAFTMATTPASMATASTLSRPSNFGCLAGATWALNLLQWTKSCGRRSRPNGRTSVLHGEGRNPQGQADLPQLSRRIRSPGALEGLAQEKGTSSRRQRGRSPQVCQSHLLHGSPG